MRASGWMMMVALLGAGGTAAAEAGAQPVAESFSDFIMRGNLMRSASKFAAGGPVRVAFMGGSVTTQQWREPVMKYLRERFPKAQFDFVMAGVGGTDANLGAFRLPRDVFSRGPVDLFFLEFAVNGGGVRAMEGIVRQARRTNPAIDILVTYFANTGHCDAYNKGQVPGIVKDHEQVTERYGLPSLWFYREVAKRVKNGSLKWKEFSGDVVHPTALGCDLYAKWFVSFLDQAWADMSLKPAEAALPAPLDPLCYERGNFVPADAATIRGGFKLVKQWRTEKTCNFAPPVDVLEATAPGAELSLKFDGPAIGLYLIAGFDAGTIEYTIDGGAAKTVDLFDMPWCTMFHRPVHRMLADNLAAGPHELVIRMTDKKHAKSVGTAMRLLWFMVNGK